MKIVYEIMSKNWGNVAHIDEGAVDISSKIGIALLRALLTPVKRARPRKTRRPSTCLLASRGLFVWSDLKGGLLQRWFSIDSVVSTVVIGFMQRSRGA